MRLVVAGGLVLALAACGTPGRAAELTIGWFEPAPLMGSTFDVTFSVIPEAGENIIAYQFDILFADWLIPQSITELGYFAANGVFFTGGTTGTGFQSGISNIVAGLVLPGATDLFSIKFLVGDATGSLDATPNIRFGDDPLYNYLLNDGFSDVPINSVTYLTPEPATFVVTGSAIVAVLLRRRRR